MKTLRELREEQGVSPMQIALDLDVSLATIYNWETGKTEPRATQLRKLAESLGVCMEDITFESEKVKKAAARFSLAAA